MDEKQKDVKDGEAESEADVAAQGSQEVGDVIDQLFRPLLDLEALVVEAKHEHLGRDVDLKVVETFVRTDHLNKIDQRLVYISIFK